MKNIHQYIAVMGTLGSGKTTAANLISRHFKLHILEENFDENVFLPRFYVDMKRWAFHSQMFFLTEKIRQTLATATLLGKSGVIQDTPIVQDVFSYAKAQFELGHMDEAEWKLYLKIYREFEPVLPVPDLIIYLSTSVAELKKRITRRGRGYEQKIKISYLMLLDRLNHTWVGSSGKIPVLDIVTDGYNIATNKKIQKDFLQRISAILTVK